MAVDSTPFDAVELFYSYAHADEEFRDQLQNFLVMLRREGVISEDRAIGAGTEWAGEIDRHLESAGVILLLMSQDFLASRYCWDVEVKRAMERHESGDARVIPVILRPSDWQNAPFAKLQVLPKDGRPITRWEDRDEALLNVTQGIRAAVRELRSRP